jgi:hypothetical protein
MARAVTATALAIIAIAAGPTMPVPLTTDRLMDRTMDPGAIGDGTERAISGSRAVAIPLIVVGGDIGLIIRRIIIIPLITMGVIMEGLDITARETIATTPHPEPIIRVAIMAEVPAEVVFRVAADFGRVAVFQAPVVAAARFVRVAAAAAATSAHGSNKVSA